MKPSGDRLVPIETDRFTVGRSIKNTHAVYNGGNDEQGNTVLTQCSLTSTVFLSLLSVKSLDYT